MLVGRIVTRTCLVSTRKAASFRSRLPGSSFIVSGRPAAWIRLAMSITCIPINYQLSSSIMQFDHRQDKMLTTHRPVNRLAIDAYQNLARHQQSDCWCKNSDCCYCFTNLPWDQQRLGIPKRSLKNHMHHRVRCLLIVLPNPQRCVECTILAAFSWKDEVPLAVVDSPRRGGNQCRGSHRR